MWLCCGHGPDWARAIHWVWRKDCNAALALFTWDAGITRPDDAVLSGLLGSTGQAMIISDYPTDPRLDLYVCVINTLHPPRRLDSPRAEQTNSWYLGYVPTAMNPGVDSGDAAPVAAPRRGRALRAPPGACVHRPAPRDVPGADVRRHRTTLPVRSTRLGTLAHLRSPTISWRSHYRPRGWRRWSSGSSSVCAGVR